MVRSMLCADPIHTPRPALAPAPGQPLPAPRALLAAVAVAVLAGCASGPRPGGNGASSTQAKAPTDVPLHAPATPARPGDRDGAPRDAPPDLAALPDAVPQVEPIKPSGPNKPYVVLGQAYEPLQADVSWKERGAASWYGTKFHGRRTASGEVFNMYGLTAAHRTLPIPSYARVRYPATGKEIIVRVNDRGPFHAARVMDLSYAAAVKLGIVSMGSAQVEIERLTFDEIRTGAWRRGEGNEGNQVATTSFAAVATQQTALAEPAVAAQDPVLSAAQGRVHDAIAASGIDAPAAAAPDAVTEARVASATQSRADARTKEAQARAYTTAAKGFWVQLAALGKLDGVDKLQQRVASELSVLQPLMAVFHESPYFKLQVGPYGSRDQALAAAQQAREALQLTPMVIERR